MKAFLRKTCPCSFTVAGEFGKKRVSARWGWVGDTGKSASREGSLSWQAQGGAGEIMLGVGG